MMAGRAIAAPLLGALIGWNRERHGQDVGTRAYAAVALGACVFGLVSSTAAIGLAMAYGVNVCATLTAILLTALLLAHHLRTLKTAPRKTNASRS